MKTNLSSAIEHLKNNGWNESQIEKAIINLANEKPQNLKVNFRSLVYFFAVLPTNESAVSNSDLVDINTAFSPEQFKSLMWFINEFQSGL